MASLDMELLALDRALWQAAMDGRLTEFRDMMSGDYQGLYARGFVTSENDASVTATMKIRSFGFENYRVRELGLEAVLATYITVLDATAGEDRDISGRYASTSVWERTAEGWRLVYHAEIRLA